MSTGNSKKEQDANSEHPQKMRVTEPGDAPSSNKHREGQDIVLDFVYFRNLLWVKSKEHMTLYLFIL